MNLVGKRLGPYKVIAPLGEGAMAQVYRAEHVALGRAVAIKVPHAPEEVAEEAVARFRREGKLLASVKHPGVVEVIDFDEEDGILYLAMALVEAPTLDTVLAQAPGSRLPEARAVAIASSLLDALGAIHVAGIVHRDLKPANVFIEDDRAILADFGVARPLGDHTLITADGTAVGTFLYMAPEQHEDAPMTPRTDLYSAGLLLYRMACGELPFAGTLVDVMRAKTHHASLPGARTLHPELSEGLDAVLLKACRTLPSERFRDAAEFRAALAALEPAPRSGPKSRGRPPATPRPGGRLGSRDRAPTETRRRRTRSWALLAGAVLGAATIAALALMSRAPAPIEPPASASPPSREPSAAPSARPVASPRPSPRVLRGAARRSAALDVEGMIAQMRTLWPGYAPQPLELDLARFFAFEGGTERDARARELAARMGSLLPERIMIDLAEQALIFPDFLPHLLPGKQLAKVDRRRWMPLGSDGLLDNALFDVIGSSAAPTALAFVVGSANRTVDLIANARTGGSASGVTMVDLLGLIGYLSFTQPGFHARTGEHAYRLFTPKPEDTRPLSDSANPAEVGRRARDLDTLITTHFRLNPVEPTR